MKNKKPLPRRIDATPEELAELLACAEKFFSPKQYTLLQGLVETVTFLSQSLQDKSLSLKRLLKMLFGIRTEKTGKVFPPNSPPQGSDEKPPPSDASASCPDPPRRKGHGRNGTGQYTGAETIPVRHPTLQPGDRCPHCNQGRVYDLSTPGLVVRVIGQAPLHARIYEIEKLRCNSCSQVFAADTPPEAQGEKYDEAAGSMIALLKYGTGVPFYRLEQLQGSLGIPLPASTQWEIGEGVANKVYLAFEELIRQGAQGEIVHNDDTTARILALMKKPAQPQEVKNPQDSSAETDAKSRTGLFTTAIVSRFQGHSIALFFTGREHAGESLAQVLARRDPERSPPIQMCDALSRNDPKGVETFLAHCLAHGRRKFVDVAENFPQECRYLLETLCQVYHHEAICQEQNLSPPERLQFHQEHSGPLMEQLHQWLRAQFDQKLVEPNSGLGQAISYMLKHWEPLTLFLRRAGAPLDNNLCERALKKAILNRKNAYFFKTEHGAYVGDLFMSLIHTCQLCGANPFDYLTQLQKHSAQLRQNPGMWMPWNYRQTLNTQGQAGEN